MDESTPPPARKRRRVYATAGLTASAAVLAMSVQAGVRSDDGTSPVSLGDPVAQTTATADAADAADTADTDDADADR